MNDYCIFPVAPNSKVPLIKDWPNAASNDPTQIADWWKQFPNANVGLVTGVKNTLVVLDVDPRNGGEQSLSEMESLNGRLPETHVVKTPQGGRHYYFRTNKEIPKRTLAPGLDLQAERAYVLVPPSIVDGKPYEYFVTLPSKDWPEPPPWLLSIAAQRSKELGQVGPGVGEGGRNRALFEYVCWLLGKGVTNIEEKAHARNQTYSPPLAEPEVLAIIASASLRYSPPEERETSTIDPTIDLVTAAIPNVNWLWENRIERGTICVFAGQFASGKSTMAAHVAELVSTAGEHVLFLQYENFSGLLRRVAAARSASHMSSGLPGTGQLRAWPQSSLIYLDNEGRQRLFRHITQHKVALVVIDVLVSAIKGVEWTNEQQMRTVIDPIERFAGESKTTFLVLIHVNKSEGLSVEARISGSNAVPTAARNIHLFLRNPDDPSERLMAEVKNSSGYQPAPTLRFGIESGENGGGRAVIRGTSLYTAQEAISALRTKYTGSP